MMLNKRKKFSKDFGFSSGEEEELFLFHSSRYDFILSEIKKLSTKNQQPRILDLGSGGGNMLYVLNKDSYRNLFAVEKIYKSDRCPMGGNKEFNKILKKRGKKFNFKVAFCDFTQDKLPYGENFFDLIIFSEVLEHLYDGVLFTFQEICRVLKPGGYLIITTPNVRSLNNIFQLFLNNIYENIEHYTELPLGIFHFRLYNLKEIEYLFNKVGLKCVKKKYLNLHRIPLSHLDSVLYRFFLKTYYYLGNYLFSKFNQYCYVVGRKP